MKETDVIKSLKAVAKEKPDINEEVKNAMIAGLLNREIPLRSRGGSMDFLWSQIGFVNKIVWFWQDRKGRRYGIKDRPDNETIQK